MDIASFVSIFESTKVQFFLELQAALGVFSILSYNPPEAPYNIIYRIEIEDIRFFYEAFLRGGEFHMKEKNQKSLEREFGTIAF